MKAKTLPADEIRERLAPGEELLWLGRPRQGLRFFQEDGPTLLFSILWTGFVFMWEAIALVELFGGGSKKGGSWIMALWGIPFVLIGIYLLAGRHFHDRRIRRGTAYAVTNRRLMISWGLWRRQVISLPLENLLDSEIRLVEKVGVKFGTIYFGRFPEGGKRRTQRDSGPPYDHKIQPVFDYIEDAGAVFHIIVNARSRHFTDQRFGT